MNFGMMLPSKLAFLDKNDNKNRLLYKLLPLYVFDVDLPAVEQLEVDVFSIF